MHQGPAGCRRSVGGLQPQEAAAEPTWMYSRRPANRPPAPGRAATPTPYNTTRLSRCMSSGSSTYPRMDSISSPRRPMIRRASSAA
ncbi:hypothetical protein M911_16275 [Ectothiorhodospira haloalkaliphila]|uniref:Uncharacterized protein n=1 Tax=Ectothiorhodospira haloalkaliphila TaxID=421628 RepID=W8KXY6_9GAMM|nr:hypothetical protein M911_16275 [Ectothiorhodospira haloalkaliphila]